MAVISDVFDGRSQYTLRLTVTQTSQNISANQSTISWLLEIIETSEWGSWSGSPLTWSININGSSNSGSTTYNFNNYNSLTLGSGTKTITHNSDGTKSINFSMSAGGGTTIGAASDSGSMSLTTIPRASSSSFSPDNQINAGESVTINTNRASTSFTHTITYVFGDVSGTIGTGVGASVSWTPSLSLMNEIPNATSGVGTVTTKTYNGGTLIGTTSVNFRLHVPTSIVPDFTTVTHSEATAGVAANVGAYVQQVSTLNLAITGAAGAYSSTITAYELKVISAGVTRQTITAQSGTTSPIMVSGTVTLQGKITDSRGRTKTKTVDITVLAWAPPVPVDINVQRSLLSGTPDEEGTYIRVNINATISSLMNTTQRNSLGYRISTRPRDTTTWTLKTTQNPGGTSFNGSSVVGTYPVTESYDVLVEVFDDFATTAVQLVIATSAIFMHWGNRALGQGLGIGKFWEQGAVDVAGQIYQNEEAVLDELNILSYAHIPPLVASATERDTLIPSPVQGQRVYRSDLSMIEVYYAAYHASLNPAGGNPAGWYPETNSLLIHGVVQNSSYTNNSFSSLGNTASQADREFDTIFDPFGVRDTDPAMRYAFNALWNGWYRIRINVEWASNTSGHRAIRIDKNASTGLWTTQIAAADISTGSYATMTDVYLTTSDYINVAPRQTSGGTLNLVEAKLNMEYIRPGY